MDNVLQLVFLFSVAQKNYLKQICKVEFHFRGSINSSFVLAASFQLHRHCLKPLNIK